MEPTARLITASTPCPSRSAACRCSMVVLDVADRLLICSGAAQQVRRGCVCRGFLAPSAHVEQPAAVVQPIAGQRSRSLHPQVLLPPCPASLCPAPSRSLRRRIEVLQRLPCARPPRRLSAPGLNDLLHARIDARRIPVKPVRLPAERILRRHPRPLRGRPLNSRIGRERVVPARRRVVGRAVVVGKAQPRADRVVRLMQPVPLRLVVPSCASAPCSAAGFSRPLPLRPA